MRESKITKVHALVAQRGGWGAVFSAIPSLSQAFERPGRQFPCPKSGGGKTKFRFYKDCDATGGAFHNDVRSMPDGIDVIAWYLGTDKSAAMDEIIQICGGDLSTVSALDTKRMQQQRRQISDNPISEAESAKRKLTISKIWRGVQPLVGSTAECYLRNRGIKGDLSVLTRNLHAHPTLSYKENDKTPWEKYPGMLAIIRDGNGKALTLHRTFLEPNGSGKAPVSRQKMMVQQPAPLNGGCIRLDQPVQMPHGKLIGVCEGIETALSVREATGCPMWVGISDYIMEQIAFPDDVKVVVVWADLEKSGAGLRAANAIKARLEPKGVTVLIEAPTQYGRDEMDWNDVYVEHGSKGFDLIMEPQYRVYTGVEVE
ncbi:DUF7146 domain-containing protein [Rheinheimera hassiensis]|uniref:DUF7146 domain-containing protein n=1 Tax=Rheinheimera hassiensis TaxID=1193627 RepID=UPI001F05E3D9|nr:toprim domain-containing protein [Rheinheimera hassiensis]